MKRISMYALTLVAATQLLAGNVFAQEKKEKVKEKKEQIVIRKSGDKNEKTTIIIEGDKVTVNGKPVTKGDKDIIIQRYSGDDHVFLWNQKMPKTPRPEIYRYHYDRELMNHNKLLKEFKHEWKSGPLLGVVTEENEKGALIEEVQKETAAEKAGLKKGDIITKVDGKKIANPSELAEAISAKKPNDEVEITYLRDGKEQKTKAKLGESKFPGGMGIREFKMGDGFPFNGDHEFKFEMREPFNGQFKNDVIRIHNRPQLGATIQDTEEGNGVKVLEVDAESPAAKSGLMKDDVITEINDKKTTNVGEAREALYAKNEKSVWNLKVLRAGKTVNIEVKIPKNLRKADL
jgi:serine protease Do